MARLVARGFTISLDGYGAGPSQSLENPLGVGGLDLHDWLVSTRTFKRMYGGEGGDTGIDEGCEHLLAGLDLPALGYRCAECVPGAKAVHYVIARI